MRNYVQSFFDRVKARIIGTIPNYRATPLQNFNDPPGRRDGQFENHWFIQTRRTVTVTTSVNLFEIIGRSFHIFTASFN